MSELRLAIVSDLHVFDHACSDTHITTSPSLVHYGNDPALDLFDYVTDSGIKADYLVVGGDMTNKGYSAGLPYAWGLVQKLAMAMGAELVAVPGNHDVVTQEPAADIRSHLKALAPSFPSQDSARDTHFWEHGWTVLEEPTHRILMLDSTIDFPPFPSVSKASAAWREYQRSLNCGAFTLKQEAGLDEYLRGADQKINIAVVHHHPLEHQLKHIFQDTYGPMRRGGDLIDLLTRHSHAGRWLVIHGHKHVPQLVNGASSSSNAPIVMCAASLGAGIWAPINTAARNQFHVVDVTDDNHHSLGTLLGSVRSAMWCLGEGWIPSPPRGTGLPSETGFGCVVDHRNLALRCNEELNQSGSSMLGFGRLVAAIPELQFIPPQDFELLEKAVERDGIEFTRGRDQRIREIARRVI